MTIERKVNKKKVSAKTKKPKEKKVMGTEKVSSKKAKLTKVKSKISKKVVPVKNKGKYIETIGRRKTSRARVRTWTKGEKTIFVNGKPYKDYFPTFELQQIVIAPLSLMKLADKFSIVVKVAGGGIHSQAEAIRHGIARALVEFNPDFRKRLKRAGFLTRDPRMRERKKFGLKRARRAPQWQKR